MKNPFKPDTSERDRDHRGRDNPVVPDAVERHVERGAERAAMYDNPLVPNAIERPIERAAADDRSAVVNRGVMDRPGIHDGPGDRPLVQDSPADIARGRDAADYQPGTVGPSADGRRASSGSTLHEGAGHIELFPHDELAQYRSRWESIQTGFVDEPRAAVEQADALVSQVVTRLTDVFTRERSTLEGQWTKGGDVSTEDLRIALTRYRSFFHRLLSM
jgi:hypothetical protein